MPCYEFETLMGSVHETPALTEVERNRRPRPRRVDAKPVIG